MAPCTGVQGGISSKALSDGVHVMKIGNAANRKASFLILCSTSDIPAF